MGINTESQVPAVPIDLPSRLDRMAGPELEQFIQARWMITAALLRQALQKRGAAQLAGRKL